MGGGIGKSRRLMTIRGDIYELSTFLKSRAMKFFNEFIKKNFKNNSKKLLIIL